jgi:ubiquitin carboxyl-terminal hydrolase 4/11/15
VIGDKTNDPEIAALAWQRHKQRNNSIIVDLMYGQLRSRLICPRCHRVSIVFDPYATLSLPLERRSIATRVVFVPLSQDLQPRMISIVFQAYPTTDDISRLTSAAVGRELRAVIGRVQAGAGLSWGADRVGDSLSPGDVYYVFEIDTAYHIWVPCYVELPGRSEEYGPVLLPVADVHAREPAIAAVAEHMFSWMWRSRSDGWSLLFDVRFAPGSHGLSVWYEQQNLSQTVVFASVVPRFAAYFNTSAVIERMNRWKAVIAGAENRAERGGLSLERCLRRMAEPEILDEHNQWFCKHCREHVCAEKKLDIWSVPELLIIHLKRFSTSGYGAAKIETEVEFPDRLDMTPFVVSPRTGPLNYKLYAVSEHYGALAGGHYTAHALVRPVLGEGAGEWYSFDDTNASRAEAAAAHSSLAYVLFYERIPGCNNNNG